MARLHSEGAECRGPLLGVAFLGDGLRIGTGDLQEARRPPNGISDGRDRESQLDGLGAAFTRIVVGGEPMSHPDVALRFAGRALGEHGVDSVTLDQQGGHVVGARHAQPHRTHSRADGGQQVGLARGAENPYRALRRLLERLEQHVRGALGHTVRVFDHDHAVAGHRRGELRGRHQFAHLVDRDDHTLRREDGQIGVCASRHLGAVGADPAPAVAAEQRRGERVGEVRTARTRRAGDEPGVRHGVGRSVSGCAAALPRRALRSGAEDLDGGPLAGEIIPNAHAVQSTGRPWHPASDCDSGKTMPRAGARRGPG